MLFLGSKANLEVISVRLSIILLTILPITRFEPNINLNNAEPMNLLGTWHFYH